MNFKVIVGGTAAVLILGSVAFAQTSDMNTSQPGTAGQQMNTAPSRTGTDTNNAGQNGMGNNTMGTNAVGTSLGDTSRMDANSADADRMNNNQMTSGTRQNTAYGNSTQRAGERG